MTSPSRQATLTSGEVAKAADINKEINHIHTLLRTLADDNISAISLAKIAAGASIGANSSTSAYSTTASADWAPVGVSASLTVPTGGGVALALAQFDAKVGTSGAVGRFCIKHGTNDSVPAQFRGNTYETVTYMRYFTGLSAGVNSFSAQFYRSYGSGTIYVTNIKLFVIAFKA